MFSWTLYCRQVSTAMLITCGLEAAVEKGGKGLAFDFSEPLTWA